MPKLGKKDPVYDAGALTYSAYAGPAATPPVRIAAPRVSDWGMLGNDQYGDCVFAGADHEHICWSAEVEHASSFTAQEALADYSAVTGFNPADPSTDRGTDVLAALKYRRKTGVIGAYGRRHKIGAYAQIEPGHVDHVKLAISDFNAVGIGIQFPGSAMDQFNAGKPWTVVAGATEDGGHYIPLVGYDASWFYCVTWGKLQRLSYGFFAEYCDEAYALLSTDSLNKAGYTRTGLNLAQLVADLKAVTG